MTAAVRTDGPAVWRITGRRDDWIPGPSVPSVPSWFRDSQELSCDYLYALRTSRM